MTTRSSEDACRSFAGLDKENHLFTWRRASTRHGKITTENVLVRMSSISGNPIKPPAEQYLDGQRHASQHLVTAGSMIIDAASVDIEKRVTKSHCTSNVYIYHIEFEIPGCLIKEDRVW